MAIAPSYYTSPYYKRTQESLLGFGEGILEGDVPDYFKEIGEAGGAGFQKALSLVTEKIRKGVLETGAKLRLRGPAVAQITAEKTAEAAIPMTFKERLRSIEGKKFLLGKGLGAIGEVGTKGLSEMGVRNQFELALAKLEQTEAHYQETLDLKKKSEKSKMWGDLFSAGIGGIASLYGANLMKNIFASAAGTGGAAGSGYGQRGAELFNIDPESGTGFIR